MHKRLFPKVNKFTYGVYYLFLPLSKLYSEFTLKNLAINKKGILSFYEKDHGNCRENIEKWIRNILVKNKLNTATKEVVLVTLPRIFGYVFNPVSFWLCLNQTENLIAVLAEVNNTFGETHSYLCTPKDGTIIKATDSLIVKKLFHVSPFLERNGSYQFRFSFKEKKLGIWIDVYNEDGRKQLVTSLVGGLVPLTKQSLRQVFFKYPLITFKTIYLIHWQALRLLLKGVGHITKPRQLEVRLSSSEKVTKNQRAKKSKEVIVAKLEKT